MKKYIQNLKIVLDTMVEEMGYWNARKEPLYIELAEELTTKMAEEYKVIKK